MKHVAALKNDQLQDIYSFIVKKLIKFYTTACNRLKKLLIIFSVIRNSILTINTFCFLKKLNTKS